MAHIAQTPVHPGSTPINDTNSMERIWTLGFDGAQYHVENAAESADGDAQGLTNSLVGQSLSEAELNQLLLEKSLAVQVAAGELVAMGNAANAHHDLVAIANDFVGPPILPNEAPIGSEGLGVDLGDLAAYMDKAASDLGRASSSFKAEMMGPYLGAGLKGAEPFEELKQARAKALSKSLEQADNPKNWTWSTSQSAHAGFARHSNDEDIRLRNELRTRMPQTSMFARLMVLEELENTLGHMFALMANTLWETKLTASLGKVKSEERALTARVKNAWVEFGYAAGAAGLALVLGGVAAYKMTKPGGTAKEGAVGMALQSTSYSIGGAVSAAGRAQELNSGYKRHEDEEKLRQMRYDLSIEGLEGALESAKNASAEWMRFRDKTDKLIEQAMERVTQELRGAMQI